MPATVLMPLPCFERQRSATWSTLPFDMQTSNDPSLVLLASPLLPAAADSFPRLPSGLFPSLSPIVPLDGLHYGWDARSSPLPHSTNAQLPAAPLVTAPSHHSPQLSPSPTHTATSSSASSASSSSSPSPSFSATRAVGRSDGAVTAASVVAVVAATRRRSSADTDPPPPRRRASAAITSKEETATRKRLKQRECDIQRRERENGGYKRLSTLLASHREDEQYNDDDDDDDDSDAADRAKLNKAAVLRRTAERIQQLQRAVADLIDARPCHPSANGSGHEVCGAHHPPPSFWDELPAALLARMSAKVRSASIRASFSNVSSNCLLLVHVPSGLVIDCSDRYLQFCHQSRSDVVGRRLFQPLRETMNDPLQATRAGGVAAAINDNRVLVAGSDGRKVVSKQEPQYERSMRAIEDLFLGKVSVYDALWRSPLGDGKTSDPAATPTLSPQPRHTAAHKA